MMAGAEAPEVLVGREGALGHIRLNRPRALNSLTLDMVRAMNAALDDANALPAAESERCRLCETVLPADATACPKCNLPVRRSRPEPVDVRPSDVALSIVMAMIAPPSCTRCAAARRRLRHAGGAPA